MCSFHGLRLHFFITLWNKQLAVNKLSIVSVYLQHNFSYYCDRQCIHINFAQRMVPVLENWKNLVLHSIIFIRAPRGPLYKTQNLQFYFSLVTHPEREGEVQATDFTGCAVWFDTSYRLTDLRTLYTSIYTAKSSTLNHPASGNSSWISTLTVITMFESSTTGLLFRVLRVIALTTICLASLAPLPRALASEPTCEITSEQEQQIVETHNWLRSTVRPNATNMRRLVSEITI